MEEGEEEMGWAVKGVRVAAKGAMEVRVPRNTSCSPSLPLKSH